MFPPINHPFGWPLPVARLARLPKLPGNLTVACPFPGKTGDSRDETAEKHVLPYLAPPPRSLPFNHLSWG